MNPWNWFHDPIIPATPQSPSRHEHKGGPLLDLSTVNVKLPQELKEYGALIGLDISRPCSQSILLKTNIDPKVAFSVRVCPTWDATRMCIANNVIHCKQLAGAVCSLTSWLTSFGVTLKSNHASLVLTSHPIISTSADGMTFQTTSEWVFQPTHVEEEQSELSVWVLSVASRVLTSVRPSGVDDDDV